MYIFIIIDTDKISSFTNEALEKEFIYDGNKFRVNENWVGFFYSFFAYKENDIFFLAGIDYVFSADKIEENLINILKKASYIFFQEDKSEDLMPSIYIDLQFNTLNSVVMEEVKFSQLFTNDYLYKSESLNKYCFVFQLPNEIKVKDILLI